MKGILGIFLLFFLSALIFTGCLAIPESEINLKIYNDCLIGSEDTYAKIYIDDVYKGTVFTGNYLNLKLSPGSYFLEIKLYYYYGIYYTQKTESITVFWNKTLDVYDFMKYYSPDENNSEETNIFLNSLKGGIL